MLSKLLFGLSIAALLGGSLLAVKNRSTLVELRQAKNANNDAIKAQIAKLDELKGKVGTEAAGIADAKAQKEEKQIAKDKAEADKKSRDKDLVEVSSSIATTQNEIKKREDAITAALAGAGGTLDELSTSMEQLTRDNDQKAKEKETLTAELDSAKAAVAKNEEQLTAVHSAISDRKKAVALNGTEGTILASNPEMGFAVVNMGQDKGVTGDAKLIVLRGGQRIGVLSVTSVEKNRTLGDVVADSLQGDFIAPGDKVIFEKTAH
jgi:hypothetical protein